jgi:hypothetical protein
VCVPRNPNSGEMTGRKCERESLRAQIAGGRRTKSGDDTSVTKRGRSRRCCTRPVTRHDRPSFPVTATLATQPRGSDFPILAVKSSHGECGVGYITSSHDI